MIELLRLVVRLAGEVHAQALEHVLIDAGEDDGGVYVAAGEFGQRVHGLLGVGVSDGADRQGDEHFICVQARVVVAHVLDLQMLNRLYDAGGYKRDIGGNTAEVLERV